MVARSSGVGLLLVVLTGCGVHELCWYYTCDHPEPEHLGPDGNYDACHEQDVDGGTDGGVDGGTEGSADGCHG